MEPNNKKIIILSVIAFLVILGVLFLMLFGKNLKIKNAVNINKNQAQIEAEANNVIIDKIKSADLDLDGLSDNQEKQFKTDPKNPDTDGDGVMDSYEINITKTDPLKKDTDGDSLNDGYEVSHLMDPLKKNKLK